MQRGRVGEAFPPQIAGTAGSTFRFIRSAGWGSRIFKASCGDILRVSAADELDEVVRIVQGVHSREERARAVHIERAKSQLALHGTDALGVSLAPLETRAGVGVQDQRLDASARMALTS